MDKFSYLREARKRFLYYMLENGGSLAEADGHRSDWAYTEEDRKMPESEIVNNLLDDWDRTLNATIFGNDRNVRDLDETLKRWCATLVLNEAKKEIAVNR